MNHDENKNSPKDMRTWIEPELEARVVAWVAGEASAFEIAELERLVAEKPELAIFKRRIEAVQGLVGEAVRPDKEPLRLAAERREKLLAAIGAAANASAGGSARKDVTVAFPLSASRKRWAKWQWTIGVAATLAFGGFFALLVESKFSGNFSQPMRPDPQATIVGGESAMRVEHTSSSAEMYANQARKAAMDQARLAKEARSGAQRQKEEREQMERAPVAVVLPERPDFRAGLPGFERAETDSRRGLQTELRESEGRQAFVAPANPGAVSASPPAAPAASRFSGGGFGGGRGGRGGAGGGRVPVDREEAVATPSKPIVMQPFEVSAERDRGYAAGNTISGTRLNSPLGMEGMKANTLARESLAAAKASGAFEFKQTPALPAVAVNEFAPNPSSVALKLELTPFEVSADKDRGNMLSGGRLNSSMQDLAGSITVTTKQQLADVGAMGQNRLFYDSPLKKEMGPVTPAAVSAVAQDLFADFKLSDIDGAVAMAGKKAGETHALLKDRADPTPPPRIVVPVVPIGETSAAQEAVSTFSLHVSDVSFRLAQAALARGEMPDATRIRPEEFYNAFDYGDPVPTVAEKVGVRIEQSAHPVAQQRNLVRIALKVPATGRGAGVPLRLTVLLDTSGSMEREDRAAVVRNAMGALVSLLGPNDRVTLIGFARQPRLLAEAVPGNEAGRLLELIANTPPEGGTNLEEALKLAGELATRHYLAAAQNRIVLMTDGAANLGDVVPATLAARVETLRRSKIALDVCGVGLNGLDDTMLEALARKGDGRYYALDAADGAARPETARPEVGPYLERSSAGSGFARQLAGAFRPAAENVKVQVRFNPARLGDLRGDRR
ncbi:MAG: von Willebrand factor type A domain-containing protein, partial [Opitutaceae bacterium]